MLPYAPPTGPLSLTEVLAVTVNPFVDWVYPFLSRDQRDILQFLLRDTVHGRDLLKYVLAHLLIILGPAARQHHLYYSLDNPIPELFPGFLASQALARSFQSHSVHPTQSDGSQAVNPAVPGEREDPGSILQRREQTVYSGARDPTPPAASPLTEAGTLPFSGVGRRLFSDDEDSGDEVVSSSSSSSSSSVPVQRSFSNRRLLGPRPPSGPPPSGSSSSSSSVHPPASGPGAVPHAPGSWVAVDHIPLGSNSLVVLSWPVHKDHVFHVLNFPHVEVIDNQAWLYPLASDSPHLSSLVYAIQDFVGSMVEHLYFMAPFKHDRLVWWTYGTPNLGFHNLRGLSSFAAFDFDSPRVDQGNKPYSALMLRAFPNAMWAPGNVSSWGNVLECLLGLMDAWSRRELFICFPRTMTGHELPLHEVERKIAPGVRALTALVVQFRLLGTPVSPPPPTGYVPSEYLSPGQSPRPSAPSQVPEEYSREEFPPLSHQTHGSGSVPPGQGKNRLRNSKVAPSTRASSSVGSHLPPPPAPRPRSNLPPPPSYEPYNSAEESLSVYMNRVHYALGPDHVHYGTLRKHPPPQDYAFIHCPQLDSITKRQTFVPNTILRRWELLSSDKSQVEFMYESPSGRPETLSCTWAAVVPSADWVHPSPDLPSQSSDSLVPLSASDRACSWNKKAYWVVPADVSTAHVNMAVHELTEQFWRDRREPSGYRGSDHARPPRPASWVRCH